MQKDRISRRAIKAHFKGLTYAELCVAGRELDKLLIQRVASNPKKARREIEAFDRENPGALLRLRF